MAMVVRANKREPRHRRAHFHLRLGRHALRSGLQPFLPRQAGDRTRPTRSSSRATPRRGSTPGRFCWAGSASSSLKNFRRELAPGGGLSSYPHPWLMPDFWEFPTVSMGLGPIMAIYQARFNHYLVDRGIKPDAQASRVWAFLGDGECDEPEALGAITLAGRERLDNLIFVVNCNLQRLDGPVRGNGKIVQELEGAFRGAGWNVIKVLWGSDWDPLLAARHRRPAGPPHGRSRRRRVSEIHRHARRVHPRAFLRRRSAAAGDGRRPERRAAAQAAPRRARSGQGLRGLQGGRRSTAARPPSSWPRRSRATAWARRAKAATSPISRRSSTRPNWSSSAAASTFPSPTKQAAHAAFYKPPEDSPEMQYISGSTRRRWAGSCPAGAAPMMKLKPPKWEDFAEFFAGSEGREVSSTMAFVRLLVRLMRDKNIGRYVVPIVPDEARTFGMEALFRQFGIYSHVGQLYEPVDSGQRALLSRGHRRADPGRGHHRGRARCRRTSPPAPPIPATASA